MCSLKRTKTSLKVFTLSGKKLNAIKNTYLELCHYFSLGVQALELYHLQGRSIFYSVLFYMVLDFYQALLPQNRHQKTIPIKNNKYI